MYLPKGSKILFHLASKQKLIKNPYKYVHYMHICVYFVYRAWTLRIFSGTFFNSFDAVVQFHINRLHIRELWRWIKKKEPLTKTPNIYLLFCAHINSKNEQQIFGNKWNWLGVFFFLNFMCGLVPIPDIYRIILHLLYIIAVIAVELFFGVQFMRFFRYISECCAYIVIYIIYNRYSKHAWLQF